VCSAQLEFGPLFDRVLFEIRRKMGPDARPTLDSDKLLETILAKLNGHDSTRFCEEQVVITTLADMTAHDYRYSVELDLAYLSSSDD
jgi:hypothetical protein